MASPGRRQTQPAAYGMQEQSNAGFDGLGLWRATPSPDVDTVLDKAIHDLAIYGIELLMNHHESSMAVRVRPVAASKIAQYALIETSFLPVCYSRHLSILHTPRQ